MYLFKINISFASKRGSCQRWGFPLFVQGFMLFWFDSLLITKVISFFEDRISEIMDSTIKS